MAGDIHSIRTEISDTTASLEHNIRELESQIRRAFSPSHQIKEHPWIALGLCVGAGMLAGSASPRRIVRRSGGIFKPAVLALVTGLAGEIVKERFPEGESYVAKIQDAVLAKATASVKEAIDSI
jgi:hypothetical protein